MNLAQFHLIDLTHTIDEKIATWNGSCGFHHEVKLSYQEKGLCVQKFSMHAGIGTHMDAPSHFFEHGKNIADLSIHDFCAPLVVIDVSDRSCPNYFLSHQDLEHFEKQYDTIPSGSFIALNTGWAKRWNDKERYRNVEGDQMVFPGYSASAADYLIDRGVVGIGIDTLSPDGSNMTTFPVHHHILGAGKYIIENMANLDQVPPIGAFICNFPMKVGIGTEAAVRSVAFINL